MSTAGASFKTNRTCRICAGEGRLYDDIKVGQQLRIIREGASVSLRRLAKSLGWSACYLSKLETGLQQWNVLRIELYLRHVEILSIKPKKVSTKAV